MATKEILQPPVIRIVPGSKWGQMCTIVKGDNPDGSEDVYYENETIKALKASGALFVNDAFLDVFKITKGTVIMSGGYGSSKTVTSITKQLIKSMNNPYHVCFYGRQELTQARKFHRMIYKVIERNGWEQYFNYSKSPTGHLTITSTIHGNNAFYAFGCDDDDSLKGMDDATDIIVDEVNQLTFDSFGMVATRLRVSGAELLLECMFNNWDVKPGHWLRTYLYSDEVPEQSQITTEAKEVLKSLKNKKIFRHHSKYTDNYFINQQRYYNELVVQSGGDPVKALGLCNGDWGVADGVMPFYAGFSEKEHTGDVEYNPALPIWVSFDENYNPYFPCGLFQIDCGKLMMIDEFAGEDPNNNIHWICRQIEQKYGAMGYNHQAGMFITGDATSKKGDTKREDGKNTFNLAEEGLIWFNPRLRVNAANPSVIMRVNFINAIMRVNYDGLRLVIGKHCVRTIGDMLNVTWDNKGEGKDKTMVLVKGKKCQRWGHFSDLLDYFICLSQPMSYIRFQQKGITFEPKILPTSVRNGIGGNRGNGLTRLRARNGY